MKNCVFKPSVSTKKWFKAASIRAAKTMAETGLALIPAMVSITAVDWKVVIGTMALSGVTSILISIKGLPEVESEG